MRSAKLSDTWRFEKGISWDSSQGEDTNLIPKNKNIGETKISYVRFYKLSCFDNVGLFFTQMFCVVKQTNQNKSESNMSIDTC